MHPPPETKAIEDQVEALRQQPDDPQAILALAQCLETLGREHLPEADRLCAELIERFPDSALVRPAEEARTRIAQASLRCFDHGEMRMEVVQYIAGALRAFERLGPRRREEIALEIALLSQGGLDLIDPAPKYALRTLPGRYCGLHLLAIMYAAFREIDATLDTGADFLREYEMAQTMVKQRSPGPPDQVPPT
jgi:hypothetical protein